MNRTRRFLTKTLYALAEECPRKLFYYGKEEYPSSKENNEFLEALAEGGFQVGALARCYYPEGILIDTLDYEKALQQTNELLKKENVTIFEAAIRFEGFFIRIDILEKKGNQLNLIEVKSKSIDQLEDSFFDKKGNYIVSGWLPYLYDVAFQTWVLQKALPEYSVSPYLMLADKNKYASVDGLNQHFFLKKDNGRTGVELKGDISPEALGEPVLSRIDVREAVLKIWEGKEIKPDKKTPEQALPYEKRIREYLGYYQKDEPWSITIGVKCKKCEYRLSDNDVEEGQKIGFRKCWREALGWDDKQFSKPHVFDIWDYRSTDKLMENGIYLMEELDPDLVFMQEKNGKEIDFKSDHARRQHLQVTKTLGEDKSEVLDPALFDEMKQWIYPLHFIDFETSMVAIPFTNHRRPYDQIAFQFSCHTVDEAGHFKHDEWISATPAYFPNFDFVRELKKVLEKDSGTIFRYANHENTVLRQVHTQLLEARDRGRGEAPADCDELLGFIDLITRWKVKNEKGKEDYEYGDRCMVDMLELVKNYYYHPQMGGSNSIKAVLPAVFSSSAFIKEKYSRPYSSKNYDKMIWYVPEPVTGEPFDPYKLLPPLYEDIDLELDELILESGNIEQGGAAMVAWARMQFTEMQQEERKAIIKGLLRYCELDTLAMEMIWEHWKSLE